MSTDGDTALIVSDAEYEHIREELDRPPRVIEPIRELAERAKRRRSW